MAYLYTLPCSQFYDELNSMDIDHSIKQCAVGPIVGQFARIFQRFPKVSRRDDIDYSMYRISQVEHL